MFDIGNRFLVDSESSQSSANKIRRDCLMRMHFFRNRIFKNNMGNKYSNRLRGPIKKAEFWSKVHFTWKVGETKFSGPDSSFEIGFSIKYYFIPTANIYQCNFIIRPKYRIISCIILNLSARIIYYIYLPFFKYK